MVGLDDPLGSMMWRRVSLLLLGIAGGVLAAATLFVSAENTYITNCINNQISSETGFSPSDDQEPILFPVRIRGTTLVAESISTYEGPFLEDGSNTEVVGIAALAVRNTGYDEVAKCYIELRSSDDCYSFYGEHIPSGATVLLLECGCSLYKKSGFLDCRGWQITTQLAMDVRQYVMIEEQSLGTLFVTNISDKPLSGVQINYKSWLSPPNIFVGGISYSVDISLLLPGQTQILYPYHYACGFSKVVSVTAK